ncbi:MAG TPA: hypothetical protein VLE96_04925 [Chlamydiales bacterium]|nr:hypothetical protein [Chlamydiales bacterium]
MIKSFNYSSKLNGAIARNLGHRTAPKTASSVSRVHGVASCAMGFQNQSRQEQTRYLPRPFMPISYNDPEDDDQFEQTANREPSEQKSLRQDEKPRCSAIGNEQGTECLDLPLQRVPSKSDARTLHRTPQHPLNPTPEKKETRTKAPELTEIDPTSSDHSDQRLQPEYSDPKKELPQTPSQKDSALNPTEHNKDGEGTAAAADEFLQPALQRYPAPNPTEHDKDDAGTAAASDEIQAQAQRGSALTSIDDSSDYSSTTDESEAVEGLDDDDDDALASVTSKQSAAVSAVTPSSTFKTYSKTVIWGGHSYTLRERLPDSTTDAAWDAIAASYFAILEDHQQYAGVGYLKLSIDPSSKEMRIDIPAKSAQIIVPSNHATLQALVKFHENGKLKDLHAFLTLPNHSPRDLQNLSPNSQPPGTVIREVCENWLIYKTAGLNEKKKRTTDKKELEIIDELLNWIKARNTNQVIDMMPIEKLLRKHYPQWFADASSENLKTWLMQFVTPVVFKVL